MKHLEEHNTCPTCDIVIHQSHPLNYISYDRTMQDIVYKLVANLQASKWPTTGDRQSATVNRQSPCRFSVVLGVMISNRLCCESPYPTFVQWT